MVKNNFLRLFLSFLVFLINRFFGYKCLGCRMLQNIKYRSISLEVSTFNPAVPGCFDTSCNPISGLQRINNYLLSSDTDSYLNSSFNIQMPFPVTESLVKSQICLSIERNTTVSLCGSLEPNSFNISWVVACPTVVHCSAMKFLISTSKLSLSFSGTSALVSLLETKLFRALILARSWLEWTGSEPSVDALLMPIWSPLKWGLLSEPKEVCWVNKHHH